MVLLESISPRREEILVSTEDSKIKVFVIPTDIHFFSKTTLSKIGV